VTAHSNDSNPLNQDTPSREATRPGGGAKSDGHSEGGETWIALCAQAAVEQDPRRLLELVSEINRLLDVRKRRLAQESGGKATQ